MAQPEYGQISRPEYGELASQYPAGYNPYVYGGPQESPDEQRQRQPQMGPQRQPQPQGNAHAAPGQSRPFSPFHGIDLNDPQQNPLYGHWDSYAILAFVLALFTMPVFPAIIGIISMWRTKTFHMKGFGLALAAVIISVMVVIVEIVMMMNGVSATDLYQWLLGQASGTWGQTGDPVSA